MLLLHNLSLNNLHQMESAISLRYCPFPFSSKGFQGAGSSRFHLRFNHVTPLCAPQISITRHPVTRSIRHANCMLERFSQPSQNERRDNKILRGVTGASLVLACVLGLFNSKMNPKLTTAHASYGAPTLDMSKLDGDVDKIEGPGRYALKSLLDIMNEAEVSTNQNMTVPSSFSDLGPDAYEVKILKLIAITENKSGRSEALNRLKEQYKECKKKKTEAEDYLGVALVEVFMLQKNLEEALKLLDDQIDELLPPPSPPSRMPFHRKKVDKTPKQKCEELLNVYNSAQGPDRVGIAQRILYKAIIHTMLEDKKAGKWLKGNTEAREWRLAFRTIL